MENAFKSFQRVKKGSPNGWKKVPQIKSIIIKCCIHKIFFLPDGLWDWIFNWKLLVRDSNSNLWCQHLALFVPQQFSPVLLPLPFLWSFFCKRFLLQRSNNASRRHKWQQTSSKHPHSWWDSVWLLWPNVPWGISQKSHAHHYMFLAGLFILILPN